MKKNHLIWILTGLTVIILIAVAALWFYEPAQAPEGPGTDSYTQRLVHLPSSQLFQPSTVGLKAGETAEENITLRTGGEGPGMVHYSVSPRVKAGYPTEEPSWPDGLNISIEPSDFMAYPNETYISTLTVTTTPDLLQGEYVFRLGSHFEGVETGGGWLTVVVN
ncbi:hypothetical protein Mpet_1556 [Methanolacinia petrolearia DSM 11571]|uniref:DUF1616 domain-containing protein n=2 Tax=Methanolacinia TaxID=230355 RepID=E1RGL8_METP4|nr:hypothetical protein Mpet_1556 [Methanolacinia petrolearia DSM 11571]